MVKKFIKRILKKKEEKQIPAIDEQHTEVPDELPPLAEESVKKTEEKEAPDELPPVSKPEDIEGSAEQSKKEALPELPPTEHKEETEHTENKILQDTKRPGFFSSLTKHTKDKEARDKLLSGDLFSRMNNYWKLKKYETKTGAVVSDEKKLEGDLFRELTQLEDLENKWHIQKKALEQDLRFLHEREKEIKLKSQELAKIVNELKLYKNVNPEKYLCLRNGVIIKNLRELISVLEILDEQTFKSHINNKRNDISNWVRTAIGDKRLAGKLDKVKTKESIINILETEPVHGKGNNLKILKIKPKDYFHLANGTVIRNLGELSETLKVMNDGVFKQHVTNEKNDFSDWVRNTLKNEHLANTLSKTKTKQGMVNLLDALL